MKSPIVFSALLLAIFTFSCKKEKPVTPAPSQFSVRMTDAPGPYTAVNVDIQGVEITGGNSSVTLNTNTGIYNLLNFSNGLDTLIATGGLTMDKVQQIRLILGPNNTVVDSGSTHPLTIPSSATSGLKLQVHQDLEPGVAYEILLDFDAMQSIVKNGNGDYHLKPVIRTVQNAISGSISGKLSQPNVPATITATSNGVSYSTVPNAAGEFIIKGLPAGTYTLTVTPASPYSPATVNNINVQVGQSTSTGTITI